MKFVIGTPLVLLIGWFTLVGARSLGMSDGMSIFPMIIAQFLVWRAVYAFAGE